ncbi:MAG: hypothetical protein A2X82_03815 [Geobacteraceae bacterium GWC2_55_20]|nr:MAG: hypothetical protein A2X82_03815 [Geobacteraceae bacterium GWC2_55_20]OGU26415.1 MAG: hypothetical protein A2X85_05330 [Geobacteraceae bacterium GWF2_54_21]HBA72565.1 hypothetical protein [Geobacter sp.]HCE67018.1 hypothetical protein [Geobacter sp.]
MPEITTTAIDELCRLKERNRKLARDKSYLQLIINLMNKVSAAQGLENMIGILLNNILDVIGGANIVLYYMIDDDLHYADIFGKRAGIDRIDDELVSRVFDSAEPVEQEHDFGDTQMLTPEFTKAYTWVFPLLAGGELIGVIKLESLHISMRELYGKLPTFFNYVASVLKNEIRSHTRLKQAFDQLRSLNKKLEEEISERTRAEKQLQEYADDLAGSNSELLLAYGELKKAQSQLLQQDKMASIGQLAAGVAHEINNPMGFIISNLGSLGKYAEKLGAYLDSTGQYLAGSDPESLAFLARERNKFKIDRIRKDLPELIIESQEGAERVRRIVQDLKSFSRVDNADLAYADINEGLESTLSIAWNELKYKATLIREFGCLPKIYCNLGQLNQVFLNILINAAHAIEDRGEIRITTREEEGSLKVAISDTGCGIPPENAGRIFDPFFTTKEIGKGTGLGLAIAYDIIVNKHGGTIAVTSEVGKGSTFTITLPIKRASGPEENGTVEPDGSMSPDKPATLTGATAK